MGGRCCGIKFLSHYLPEGIRSFRVKQLICPHQRYKILGFGQVYNVVRISREHMYSLDLIARDLKLDIPEQRSGIVDLRQMLLISKPVLREPML